MKRTLFFGLWTIALIIPTPGGEPPLMLFGVNMGMNAPRTLADIGGQATVLFPNLFWADAQAGWGMKGKSGIEERMDAGRIDATLAYPLVVGGTKAKDQITLSEERVRTAKGTGTRYRYRDTAEDAAWILAPFAVTRNALGHGPYKEDDKRYSAYTSFGAGLKIFKYWTEGPGRISRGDLWGLSGLSLSLLYSPQQALKKANSSKNASPYGFWIDLQRVTTLGEYRALWNMGAGYDPSWFPSFNFTITMPLLAFAM